MKIKKQNQLFDNIDINGINKKDVDCCMARHFNNCYLVDIYTEYSDLERQMKKETQKGGSFYPELNIVEHNFLNEQISEDKYYKKYLKYKKKYLDLKHN